MSLKRDATSPSAIQSNQNPTTDPNPNPPEEQYLTSEIEWYQRRESLSLRFNLNSLSIPAFIPYDPYSDF